MFGRARNRAEARSAGPTGYVLRVLQGERLPEVFPLTEPEMLLGRDPGCALHLPHDLRVSRRHARLFRQEGAWYLEDLGSANGCTVRGVRIFQPMLLQPGDEIRLGQTVLRLESPSEAHAGAAPTFSDAAGLETAAEIEVPSLLLLDTEPETDAAFAASNSDAEVVAAAQRVAPLAAAAPAPVVAPDQPAPSAKALRPTPNGGALLVWSPDGRGATLAAAPSSRPGPGVEDLRVPLAGLTPPPGVQVRLGERLGEPGGWVSLEADPGAQAALLQCAGEIVQRLVAAAVYEEVRLAT